MRTSSTRRLGAALSASTLALVFSLGSPAFGGEKGQGADHRKDRTESTSQHRPDSAPGDDDSIADTNPVPVDEDNAHPSGNDRHEDKGAQGHSTSTPDQNGSGPERDFEGTDKSFETTDDGLGGVDKEDQDGNNGCGNDDDFEDDNEGWCGNKPKGKPTTPVVTEVKGEVKSPEIKLEGSNPVVLGSTAVTVADLQAAPADEASVLGIQLERTAPAAVAAETAAAPAAAAPAAAAPAASVLGVSLARTGLSFTVLALAIALGLLAIGFALKRAGRTQSDF